MVTADANPLIPSYLKLIQGPECPFEAAAETALDASGHLELGVLGEAFWLATGWQLDDVLTDAPPAARARRESQATSGPESGTDNAMKPVRTRGASGKSGRGVSRRRARRLATEIGHLADLLLHTQDSLREREAELATAIPFVSRPAHEACQLALRLETILCGGAQAVGCPAAALYLLDDGTSHLKLRSQWGLADSRFLLPPRQLSQAKGDVEALAGNAVVIEDTSLLPHWNVPESFPAAVCIPIASPTVPLGTMWVFASERRDFSPTETNLLEIIAGRIAAELDREILLRENHSLRRNPTPSGKRTRGPSQESCPRVVPLIDGWEIAGAGTGDCVNSDELYEWFVHDGGELSLSLARCFGDELPSALTIAAVGGALRAHRDCDVAPGQLAQRINQALWTGSAGDQWSSLFFGILEPDSRTINYTMAGAARAFVLRSDGWEELAHDQTALGVEPTTTYRTVQRRLELGEALVFTASDPSSDPLTQSAFPDLAADRAEVLTRGAHLSAAQIVEMWRQESPYGFGTDGPAPVVLVARRTR